MTWGEMELKLAVQEAQGKYEKLCAVQEGEHSPHIASAIATAKEELDEAYRALKDYDADMAS